MDAYHILERIGEGSFGKVYRGRRKFSGHIVALKFVTKRGKNARDLQNLRDEISILRRLNHCNIIAMLDSFETEGEFCMLAVGRPPFYTERIVSLIEMIVREPVQYPPTMSPAFQSFLAGLLSKDPAQRMTWPEILAHAFVRETREQQQARRRLESQVRALPRFFSDAVADTGATAASEVSPSVERLRTSGEWAICDPETGRRISADSDRSAPTDAGGVLALETRAPSVALPSARRDGAASADKERDASRMRDPAARFLKRWRELEAEIEANARTGSAVLDSHAFQQALGALEALSGVCRSSATRLAALALLQVQYRALVGVLKAIESTTALPSVLAAREKTHRVLKTLLADHAGSKAVADDATEVMYHVVRCCMAFTSIVNARSSAGDADEHVKCREIYKTDVRAVNALLSLKGEALYSAHSKTLKWLGSMLDRSKNLSLFLEQVHPSGVVETLCAILRSSGASRSPGGRISKGGRDLGLYAAFALSTFVHPDGESWGPLQPFPIVALMCDASQSTDGAQSKAADVKLLAKLRSKVHFEVITQLLKSGLAELVALLCGELNERAGRGTSSNNSGDGSDDDDDDGDDDDDDDDQSSVCCILKVLLHGCRSSVPLTKKLPQTPVSDRPGSPATDVVSVLLASVASRALHAVELYFAVELLAAILHRGALSKLQVWQCATCLYPFFCASRDVALLSALSNFLAHAIEAGGVDESVFPATGGEREEEELWHCLARGFLPERCADAVFRLFEHEQLASLPAASRSAKLQMLTCYNIRAQGLVDAGVVLLLRVASKAGKQPPAHATAASPHEAAETAAAGGQLSVEMQSFVAAFQQDRAWTTVSTLLLRGGSDLLSPWGLFCFLKLMRVVREVQCHDPRMEAAINEHVVPYLVNLLELRHIAYLFAWPDVGGGGSNAVKALVHAVVKVLGIPFMHGVAEDLVVGTQEVLYDVECVQKLLGVLRFVFATKEFHLETSVLELPMSFLSRLVTSSEHFGAQLARADGMLVIKECGMLHRACSPSLIIDTILIVSQLARSAQANYDCIQRANLLPEFHGLLQHPEPMVRAKALNCVGNLCRHSTLFYEQLAAPTAGAPSLLDGVVRSLADPDSYVRRFACFAIGNAAFHTSALYGALRASIPLLLENLQDPEEKTRSNAGGALGNLVRNSDELCAELCRHQAPLELFELAMADASIAARRIVLFSLGNFCLYPQCYASLLAAEPDFRSLLEQLHDDADSDDVSKKNIRRILAKIDGVVGATST
ncbi:hypothetical protein PybrP1_009193 [[Pythium] brassicae (nom. inval.)]|nr:hypothetical protein PybrP1_009193 [[Pythium] brassicae (nom. inval.)]